VRFWDASAVVPLLVGEDRSDQADLLHAEDRAVVVWWGTRVEVTSALARQQRDGAFSAGGLAAATSRLRRLAASWIEVPATEPVREQALRLLRIHPLRAGDALQLAAALVTAEFRAESLEFVTFDARQAEAARLEGFAVLGRPF